MARTHYQDFVKDDGQPVTVEYTFAPGSPATYSPHSGADGGDATEVEHERLADWNRRISEATTGAAASALPTPPAS